MPPEHTTSAEIVKPAAAKAAPVPPWSHVLHDWWKEAAEAISGRWPRGAVLIDLRVLAGRVLAGLLSELPSARALATRWRWHRSCVAAVLRERDVWEPRSKGAAPPVAPPPPPPPRVPALALLPGHPAATRRPPEPATDAEDSSLSGRHPAVARPPEAESAPETPDMEAPYNIQLTIRSTPPEPPSPAAPAGDTAPLIGSDKEEAEKGGNDPVENEDPRAARLARLHRRRQSPPEAPSRPATTPPTHPPPPRPAGPPGGIPGAASGLCAPGSDLATCVRTIYDRWRLQHPAAPLHPTPEAADLIGARLHDEGAQGADVLALVLDWFAESPGALFWRGANPKARRFDTIAGIFKRDGWTDRVQAARDWHAAGRALAPWDGRALAHLDTEIEQAAALFEDAIRSGVLPTEPSQDPDRAAAWRHAAGLLWGRASRARNDEVSGLLGRFRAIYRAARYGGGAGF